MALDTSISLIDFAYMEDNYGYDSGDESLISNLINDASTLINNYTSRHLKAKTYTKVLSTYRYTDLLVLPDYPLNSVSGLWIDNSHAFDSSTEIAESDYGIDEELGTVIIYKQYLVPGNHNVKIVFNAGFLTIPEDLKGACAETVMWLIKRRARNGEGIGERSTTLDNLVTSFETTMPLNIKQTLDYYKKSR